MGIDSNILKNGLLAVPFVTIFLLEKYFDGFVGIFIRADNPNEGFPDRSKKFDL